MFSPQENVSPFDVNMACDAGYDAIIPYTNVTLPDIKSLVQDAIFSRSLTNAKKIAVTGSVGKTGTKEMLVKMMVNNGIIHSNHGNFIYLFTSFMS